MLAMGRFRGSRAMGIMDTAERYGAVSRVLHWSMAAAFFALFALWWWMVGLDYYSPYYKSAPELHRSVGLVVLLALGVRVGWRVLNIKPDDGDLMPVERAASRVVHRAFYPLLGVLMVSGYLISTADGRGIEVFYLFRVPAVVTAPGLEDAAGLVHRWSAYAVMALAVVHAAAAVKHRFFDGARLRHRMW